MSDTGARAGDVIYGVRPIVSIGANRRPMAAGGAASGRRSGAPTSHATPFSVDKEGSICDALMELCAAGQLASAPMDHDVELIRALLFSLETSQTSPRATVIISIDEEADELGCSPDEVETSLTTLLDYDYIDGPGHDAPGFFLFRKLTRKGIRFVQETRSDRDWERMKRRFAGRTARSIADLP